MAFVLDASVAVTWAFEDERTAWSDLILDRAYADGVRVPALFWFEVRNTLLLGERRGRITEGETFRFVEFLQDIPLAYDPLQPGDLVVDLARRHGLTAYDAAYLEVAFRHGFALATLDKDLRRAAQRVGVPLL